MNKKEYDDKKLAIDKEHTKKLKSLYIEYARANSTIRIGDIISGDGTIIEVQKRVAHFSFMSDNGGYPSFYFIGKRLTKKLKPFKSGEKDSVHKVDQILQDGPDPQKEPNE